MRHIRRFAVLQRKGMALLLVMFVAFASLVLLTTLFASVAPRRASVSGELQADRALAVADGKIDLLMSTVNNLPQVSESGYADEISLKTAIIAGWEGMLNGYVTEQNGTANASAISTYFYHATSNTWYAVWNTTSPDHLMSIPPLTKLGRMVSPTDSTSDTVLELGLKNLSDGNLEAGAIIDIDPDCRTNNEWFEVDSNAVYNLTSTDVWTIKASAYMLSKPDIVRTLEARAKKDVDIPATSSHTTTNVYNWFTTVNRYRSFSDYVFLDNFDVNFGRYTEVNGAVHANGTVNMGGWGKFPITSTEHVTAIAVDDSNNPDGHFGPQKDLLAWAKSHTDANGDYYAKDHATEVDWLDVDKALVGKKQPGDAQLIRNPLDPNGGMQDKAVDPYYITANATLTFLATGQVTIKIGNAASHTYALPANGIIYVQGSATVSGTVLGFCMVGASGNINIGGDILYTTPPRNKETDAFTASRDFLGLVANGNVVIPYSTYVADKNLIIDASMVADGWLGTDPDDWQWHDLNTDPVTAPTLVGRGSMAAGSGTHMLATTRVDRRWVTSGYWTGSGSHRRWVDTSDYVDFAQIKGYDLRQYNFDWNLKQLGVPDGFPVNNSGPIEAEEQGVTDAAILAQLTNPSDHGKPNPITIGGKGYYAKLTSSTVSATTWSGTGLISGGVYRIGWKEQIGEPVGGN